jgi:hypothetical protein
VQIEVHVMAKTKNPWRPQVGPQARQLDELEKASAPSPARRKPPPKTDPIDDYVRAQRAKRKKKAAAAAAAAAKKKK